MPSGYSQNQTGDRTEDAIIIGLGANLSTPEHGPPLSACRAAVAALAAAGLNIIRQSPWYESAPVPVSDQPWYVNGVIQVTTALSAEDVMALLSETEHSFGRVRGERNAPRVLDLDLIAYGGIVDGRDGGLVLPHPRLSGRAFVLLPLADILPGWRHPVSGLGLPDMLRALPMGEGVGQEIRKLPDE